MANVNVDNIENGKVKMVPHWKVNFVLYDWLFIIEINIFSNVERTKL